jgi:ribosomal protein S18 acetylase RimI-like enzyme
MSEIRPYAESELDEVAEILATAYLENPLHLVVFGGTGLEQLRQHRTLFAVSLELLNTGTKVVAVDNHQIVGFAHWISHPQCRPSAEAMGSAAPQLLAELGNDVLSRIITWRRAWGEQDPETPHSHSGPFAVHPDAQGRGFGRRLMEHYCEVIDGAGETSYLETERPENLAIYRRAGFEITAEREVLGLPGWFMTRTARERDI